VPRPHLAILLGAPFTAQNIERLGLHQLAPHCEIHVFDCARLIGRNPDAITVTQEPWPYFHAITTPDALRQALQASGATWAIDNIGLDAETAWMGSMLRQLGIGLIGVKSGLLPLPALKDRLRGFVARPEPILPSMASVLAESALERAPGGFARLASLPRKVVRRLIYAWERHKRTPAPDLVLLAGGDALATSDARKAAHKIWIGSEDFYKFQDVAARLTQGELPRRSQPFVLFVDVCLPYATDWKFLGIAPPISAEEYYPMLCRLFDRIEALLDIPVVVAGHPNTRWIIDYARLIGGRELVLGSTAALVMQSELVLTHASTATSFIALAGKPSVFVSSRGMDRTSYGSRVRAMARSLCSPLVMLEDAAAMTRSTLSTRADATACRRYVHRYLRSEQTTEIQAWQELIEFVIRNADGIVKH
jgi:hypothetical protein